MKSKLLFYLFIFALVIIDSLLISSPNLLGKIGLFIYKYHYLRTFPRTLLTVSLVISAAVLISEALRFFVSKKIMKRSVGRMIVFSFILLSGAILFKTYLDFSTWTYGHTGLRFKYGAYLLPSILILIFGYSFFTLLDPSEPWPVSPAMDDRKAN